MHTAIKDQIMDRAYRSFSDDAHWIEEALDYDSQDMPLSEGLLARLMLLLLEEGCEIIDLYWSDKKPLSSAAVEDLRRNGALRTYRIEAILKGVKGLITLQARNRVGGNIGVSVGFPLRQAHRLEDVLSHPRRRWCAWPGEEMPSLNRARSLS